ncbi:hypothetical protein [Actinomadura violacea]|uniref:Uncharacterized protein n=1 Tax=Actinomadura violacea TaxID=2819934 RepID=A0ABS3S8Y6_9ACTN|nr:hypothetical protein [Actinomadura violacea]MBO2465462.1 hypothetical protein [Actinomadura violacea]
MLDQFEVLLVPVGGEQCEADDGRASVGAMADQPTSCLPDAFAFRAQGRGGDVVVAVDGDVHVVEGPCELVRCCVGPGEELVQDVGGGGDAAPSSVGGPFDPSAVRVVVRVRLAVAGERGVGMESVEPQRVVVQARLISERSRLGRLAHRRTEDSILSIMCTA